MLNQRSSDGKTIIEPSYINPSQSEGDANTTASRRTSARSPLLPPSPHLKITSSSSSSSLSTSSSDYYSAVQHVTPYSTYAGIRYDGDHIVTTDVGSNHPAILSPSSTPTISDNNQDNNSQDNFTKINTIDNNQNDNNKVADNDDYNVCPPPESPLSPPILGTTVTAMMRERRRSSVPHNNYNRSRMKV